MILWIPEEYHVNGSLTTISTIVNESQECDEQGTNSEERQGQHQFIELVLFCEPTDELECRMKCHHHVDFLSDIQNCEFSQICFQNFINTGYPSGTCLTILST